LSSAKTDEHQLSLLQYHYIKSCEWSPVAVVSRHYGLVEAYEGKKKAIQAFKKDGDKDIANFFTEYERHLDRRILHEKKSVDEDIAIRKMRSADYS